MVFDNTALHASGLSGLSMPRETSGCLEAFVFLLRQCHILLNRVLGYYQPDLRENESRQDNANDSAQSSKSGASVV